MSTLYNFTLYEIAPHVDDDGIWLHNNGVAGTAAGAHQTLFR